MRDELLRFCDFTLRVIKEARSKGADSKNRSKKRCLGSDGNVSAVAEVCLQLRRFNDFAIAAMMLEETISERLCSEAASVIVTGGLQSGHRMFSYFIPGST